MTSRSLGRRVRMVGAGVAVGLAGCGTTDPQGTLVLAPASTELTAPAYVIYTLDNRRPETVSVPRCGSNVALAIDGFFGEQWVRFESGVCRTLAVYEPALLAPGESLTDSVWLENPAYYRLIVRYSVGEEMAERYSISPILRLTR